MEPRVLYTLLPQRGSSYSEEGERHRLRTTQVDREAKKVFFESKTDTTVKADFPTSAVAQDALSAIYVLRAIPIKAGDRMTCRSATMGSTTRQSLRSAQPSA